MTPEQQTIEKIEVAVEAEYRRRKPTMKSVPLDLLHASHAALSIIREIVLAEVRKLEEVRDFDFKFVSGQTEWRQRPRTAAEIEDRIIKVLGGGT